MELKIGYLLKRGEYRIERVLGQGGFGITYLAEQVSLGRKVAVKEFFMKELCNREGDTSHVTVPSIGSREMVDRFRDKFIKEARALAKLRHRHIVRIIDVFEENNTAYYVMEHIAGGSLSDKAKGAALPEADAVRYIRQVASALDYVHSRRMMHLDVKPGNVLLSSDNDAVLIDFGLAKQYDATGEQTSSTPVGISHGYAPMEQYKRGGVGTFSPATDIYSLGATLYKLVTGLTPPEANDVADEGLPALPQHLSANLRAAIEASMQFRRKDRPQSIDEFLALLDGAAAPVISNVSEESRALDDDGETVVGPVIAAKRSAEGGQSVEKEILRPVQDDKGAKKEKPGNGNEKSAAGVISNDSEKSHPNNGKPSIKKWIAIVAVPLLFVTVLIFGVNWYGDYCAAERERLAAIAEEQRIEAERLAVEQQRLEQERLAQEAAKQQRLERERKAKEEAERKAAAEAAEKKRLEQERLAAERKAAEQKRKEEERKRLEAAQTRGTINGHDYVDLGLSVKWATCNVGASTPGDYGNYYAWGETTTKSAYRSSTTYGKQMSSIAGNLTWDAARKNWGSPWRLPTKAEFQELIDNCTWEWTTQNGHNGYKVTSKKNGNSIFLPAAGWPFDTSPEFLGTRGFYWSATPDESNAEDACSLDFDARGRATVWSGRDNGHSVRPVSQN